MSTTFLVLGIAFLSIGYFRIFSRLFGPEAKPVTVADTSHRPGFAHMAKTYGRSTLPCILVGFACTFATMVIGAT